ncbi:hypothetical protein HZ993_12720 [Rhodoferax sp. AJA081-3]|uniref:hypothetical protein n=1 Tax=Rhodoferax sp. AJA081-3 TaxID=2752316 RepID=UPI001AE071BB|nr:hypothetical protein [Rhodoferax sp. AJA081-3]QTN26209.1 hypothetical protein HZ993_12720 [Rhodoferax sp. AJA081-3]
MLDRFRRVREPYRGLLIALATFIVLMASNTWPSLSYAIWGLFVATMAAMLYGDLREPVNYESMRISDGAIEYVAFGQTTLVRLDKVSKLEFVREEALFPDIDGPYRETKWVVQYGGGLRVEIMDEWPHRRALLQAFRKHLPKFDDQAARGGIAARREGQWLCYELKADEKLCV